jgi:hypothetical protein
MIAPYDKHETGYEEEADNVVSARKMNGRLP